MFSLTTTNNGASKSLPAMLIGQWPSPGGSPIVIRIYELPGGSRMLSGNLHNMRWRHTFLCSLGIVRMNQDCVYHMYKQNKRSPHHYSWDRGILRPGDRLSYRQSLWQLYGIIKANLNVRIPPVTLLCPPGQCLHAEPLLPQQLAATENVNSSEYYDFVMVWGREWTWLWTWYEQHLWLFIMTL